MVKQRMIKVLVAEDDFFVGKEITRILKNLGFEVIGAATTGIEAIEKAASLKPDVIVMDLEMPELDGLEATRRIQETNPTPVVVLTAYDDEEFLEQASASGAGAYLVKPPNAGDLERGIFISMARHGDLMALKKLNREIVQKNQELEKALAEVKTLRGIIPICMYCKQIRDDQGYWNQVEKYICEHSDAQFSHGICKKCLQEHYPELSSESS